MPEPVEEPHPPSKQQSAAPQRYVEDTPSSRNDAADQARDIERVDAATPDIDEFVSLADDEIDQRAIIADKEGVGRSRSVETFDLEPSRDEVRKHIAYWLLGILTLVVSATLILLATTRWTHVTTSDVRSIVELIFAPVVTLISAVTGFYYASNAQRGTRPYAPAKQAKKQSAQIKST